MQGHILKDLDIFSHQVEKLGISCVLKFGLAQGIAVPADAGGLKAAFLALKGVILKVLMSKAIVCLST